MKNKLYFLSATAATLISGSLGAAQDTATVICTAASASHAANNVPNSGTAGVTYMMSAITPKCSANVTMRGADQTGGSAYGVAANSSKGKNTFASDTNGTQTLTACATAGGCTSAEVVTAMTLVAT